MPITTTTNSTTGTNTGDETTTSIGALINGATAKTTPVDADQLGLMDSAASNVLKKLSWANLKTTALAAFVSTINAWSKAQSGAVSALTVATNAIAVDLSLANNFSVTLQATTSQVLSAPTNAVAGQHGLIYITQNATPSTLTYNTFWKFPGGTVPSVSTGAGAQDIFVYTVAPGATYADCQLQKGFA